MPKFGEILNKVNSINDLNDKVIKAFALRYFEKFGEKASFLHKNQPAANYLLNVDSFLPDYNVSPQKYLLFFISVLSLGNINHSENRYGWIVNNLTTLFNKVMQSDVNTHSSNTVATHTHMAAIDVRVIKKLADIYSEMKTIIVGSIDDANESDELIRFEADLKGCVGRLETQQLESYAARIRKRYSEAQSGFFKAPPELRDIRADHNDDKKYCSVELYSHDLNASRNR